MRQTLTYIEYACFAIAVLCLFFVLFLIGDTDVFAEPPTWVTLVLTVGGSLAAVLGAGLHWAGLPYKEEAKSGKKKD